MKKVLVLFAVVLGLTGCGTDPKTELQNASSKMNELKSYNMNMDMDMKMSSDGISINMKMNIDSDFNVTSKTGKMKMTTSFMNEKIEVDSYFQDVNGKTLVYTSEDGEWFVTESENGQGTFEFDIFKDAIEVKKVKNDGEGDKYQIKLTKDDVKQILSEIEDAGNVSMDEIEVFVYIKDGNITQMDMSLPMNVTEEGVSMNADVNMVIKFSKLNEVGEVTIPKEVSENATDMKAVEVTQYAYLYMEAIEENVIADGKITQTTLEYEGPRPTKVDVDVVSGLVTNGEMVIDGYNVTIKDGEITNVKRAN